MGNLLVVLPARVKLINRLLRDISELWTEIADTSAARRGRNGQNGPFARQMKLAITAILPLFLKTLERERVHAAAMLITWKSDSDDAM